MKTNTWTAVGTCNGKPATRTIVGPHTEEEAREGLKISHPDFKLDTIENGIHDVTHTSEKA